MSGGIRYARLPLSEGGDAVGAGDVHFTSPASQSRCSRLPRRRFAAALLGALLIVVMVVSIADRDKRQSVDDDDDEHAANVDHHQEQNDDETTPTPSSVIVVNDSFPDAEPEESGGDETMYDPNLPPRVPLVYSTEAKKLLNDLPRRCPRWTPEFMERFKTRCGYWINAIAEFETIKAKRNGPAVYRCVSRGVDGENQCNGVGDRLTGMEGALMVAMEERRPFRVQWAGLQKVFTTCAMGGGPAGAGNWTSSSKDAYSRLPTTCRLEEIDNCIPVWELKCKHERDPKFLDNLDRSCLDKKTCTELRHAFKRSLNAADVFGCPLRALLEPTSDFLAMSVPFLENNEVKTMPLREVADIIQNKYYVIAIHFRLGDVISFKHEEEFTLEQENHHLLWPFRCAATIQSYLEGRTAGATTKREVKHLATVAELAKLLAAKEEARRNRGKPQFLVEGKEVRWLLASDSESLREFAHKLFGARLLMINLRPKHVAFVKRQIRSATLSATFAEWYALGLAKELVLNRVNERGKQTSFTGRISAFPKTTWTYQLKHLFYDVGTGCIKQSLPIDGNWQEGDASTPQCFNSPYLKRPMPQPHLQLLKANGVNLPEAWVEDDDIYTFRGK